MTSARMPLGADDARRIRLLDHLDDFQMRPLLSEVRVDVEYAEAAPKDHKVFVG